VRKLLDDTYTYCTRRAFQAVSGPEKVPKGFLSFLTRDTLIFQIQQAIVQGLYMLSQLSSKAADDLIANHCTARHSISSLRRSQLHST
jgi:hypothetical protein